MKEKGVGFNEVIKNGINGDIDLYQKGILYETKSKMAMSFVKKDIVDDMQLLKRTLFIERMKKGAINPNYLPEVRPIGTDNFAFTRIKPDISGADPLKVVLDLRLPERWSSSNAAQQFFESHGTDIVNEIQKCRTILQNAKLQTIEYEVNLIDDLGRVYTVYK
jgi:hypothetical protein